MKQLELRFPPIPLTLLFALLMWAINPLTHHRLLFPSQPLLGVSLLIIGILFILPAGLHFIKAKTTVDPRVPHKSHVLVVNGLYKISRNPMYMGMLLCLLSLSFYQGNILNLLICIAFILYLQRFQIQPEERFLTEKFGRQYLEYCQKVRRWI